MVKKVHLQYITKFFSISILQKYVCYWKNVDFKWYKKIRFLWNCLLFNLALVFENFQRFCWFKHVLLIQTRWSAFSFLRNIQFLVVFYKEKCFLFRLPKFINSRFIFKIFSWFQNNKKPLIFRLRSYGKFVLNRADFILECQLEIFKIIVIAKIPLSKYFQDNVNAKILIPK